MAPLLSEQLGVLSPLPDLDNATFHRLFDAVRKLSSAHDLEEVTAIVRTAARELTGADGATFVLRDGDLCHYVDEDAIEPLWKGKRFPMSACISGWTMLNATPAVVEDIYGDSRIPADAYRPTFVQSLAMVPIRREDPVGALGIYWAGRHAPTSTEVAALQALADASAVAFANTVLYGDLKRSIHDLETLLFTASHNLREPLVSLLYFADELRDKAEQGSPEKMRDAARRIRRAAGRLRDLLDALGELARCRRLEMRPRRVGGQRIAELALGNLDGRLEQEGVRITLVPPFPDLRADPAWAVQAVTELLSNALKYSVGDSGVDVSVRGHESAWGPGIVVADRGPGPPAEMGERIFDLFKRGAGRDVPGTGAGLALVRQIAERHGGRAWCLNREGGGAEFFISFGRVDADCGI